MGKTKTPVSAGRKPPTKPEDKPPEQANRVLALKAQLCDVLLNIQQLDLAKVELGRKIDAELARMREESNGDN